MNKKKSIAIIGGDLTLGWMESHPTNWVKDRLSILLNENIINYSERNLTFNSNKIDELVNNLDNDKVKTLIFNLDMKVDNPPYKKETVKYYLNFAQKYHNKVKRLILLLPLVKMKNALYIDKFFDNDFVQNIDKMKNVYIYNPNKLSFMNNNQYRKADGLHLNYKGFKLFSVDFANFMRIVLDKNLNNGNDLPQDVFDTMLRDEKCRMEINKKVTSEDIMYYYDFDTNTNYFLSRSSYPTPKNYQRYKKLIYNLYKPIEWNGKLLIRFDPANDLLFTYEYHKLYPVKGDKLYGNNFYNVNKDAMILRIPDFNGILGTSYISTKNFPDYHVQITSLINDIIKKYNIDKHNVIACGESKGGMAAWLYSHMCNINCVANDPCINYNLLVADKMWGMNSPYLFSNLFENVDFKPTIEKSFKRNAIKCIILTTNNTELNHDIINLSQKDKNATLIINKEKHTGGHVGALRKNKGLYYKYIRELLNNV